MSKHIALTALTAGLLVCTSATALAQETTGTISEQEAAAATQAAAGSKGQSLASQLAGQDQGRVSAQSRGQGKAKGHATVRPGTTTAVHVLSPEFVSDGRGPVATLSYVANTVEVDGKAVTVWSAPEGDGWRAVNAASGTIEAQLGKKAGKGLLFQEPQVDAWYVLRGNRVMPLNEAASAAVGKGMTLPQYQRLVHGRYADKMAGSGYDQAGSAGGYEAAGQAAPAPQQADGGLDAGVAGGLAAVVALGGAGAVAVRHRRKA